MNKAGNQLPVANADSDSTEEETLVAINVTANDSDPDGDDLAVLAVDSPTSQGGTAVLDGDGATIDYTPAEDFSGQDSFEYSISDGSGGTATGTGTSCWRV